MSFYRLPPPWNPGYAIPKYVESEPPERGTITTAWLPRGTISQLIPDYLAVPAKTVAPKGVRAAPALSGVLDAIRARGVRTRYGVPPADPPFPDWVDPVRPRGPMVRRDPNAPMMSTGGSLAGHSLSGSCFDNGTLSGTSLGDDTLGAQRNGRRRQTGKRVARGIMQRAQQVAPAQRGRAIKQALGAIHTSLPARAEKHARAAAARGAHPRAALEHGIARAVDEIGASAPQASPLRGLGRGHASLGADLPIAKALARPLVANQLQIASQPTPGACRPDGFIWIGATPTVPAHWERLRAGQTCTTYVSDGSSAPNTDRGPSGGVQVTDEDGNVVKTTVGVAPEIKLQLLRVGPWFMPLDPDVKFSINRSLLADDQIKQLLSGFAKFVVRAAVVNPNFGAALAGQGGVKLSSLGWTFKVGGKDARLPKDLIDGFVPVARFNHPTTNELCAIYAGFRAGGQLELKWGPAKKTLWEKVIGFLEELVAKIISVVETVVDKVSDVVCDIVAQPGAAEAAIAANPAAGAGVLVGQKLCGEQQPPPAPPTTVTTGGGWLLPTVAIGGGLLLVYALTR